MMHDMFEHNARQGRGRERDRGRGSLKPAEAEYICMHGVYRLGRFVVLLPFACTEGHRMQHMLR